MALPVIDEQTDFYCFNCGYNLRGLPGDPKRCPECGHKNPISDLIVPADAIRQQLRRLESAPTYCFALELMVLSGVLVLVVSSQPFCFLYAIVPSLFVWPWQVRVFQDSCQNRDGWSRALIRFHLFGGLVFLLAGIMIAGLITTFMAVANSAPRTAMDWVIPVYLGLVVLVAFASYRLIFRPLHAAAIAGFEPLQRQVAIDLARKAHRRSVHRRTGG